MTLASAEGSSRNFPAARAPFASPRKFGLSMCLSWLCESVIVRSMSRRTRPWTIVFVVGALLVSGCSRSPEAQKARHLERGDKYATQAEYQEAILEYRNALRFDPVNERALKQLGDLYYQLGELAQ